MRSTYVSFSFLNLYANTTFSRYIQVLYAIFIPLSFFKFNFHVEIHILCGTEGNVQGISAYDLLELKNASVFIEENMFVCHSLILRLFI